MKKAALLAFLGIAQCIASMNCFADSKYEILGCSLVIPTRFTMRFDRDGYLSAVGGKGDGLITVRRYKDVGWGSPNTVNGKGYADHGKLMTRTWSAKGISVKDFTDTYNVVSFIGGAADNWERYLIDCNKEEIGK